MARYTGLRCSTTRWAPSQSSERMRPPAFRWIIERCLAKDPRDRYDSTVDLYRDLEQLRRRQSELSSSAPAQGNGAPAARRLGWGPVAVGAAAALWFGVVAGRV